MKEIAIYLLAAAGGIFVFGYSLHMFVGGLVSPETETIIITTGCLVAVAVMAFMARDIAKRRRGER